MTLLTQAFLSQNDFGLGLTRDDFDDLSDLADELSRVCHDDHLNLHHTHVYFHQGGDHKGTSLATSIHGLEGKVGSRVLHNLWD